MPKFCLTLVSLLAVLTATSGLAQTYDNWPQFHFAENRTDPFGVGPVPLGTQFENGPVGGEFSVQRLPAIDEPPQVLPFQDSNPTAGEEPITNSPIALDGSAEAPTPVASLCDFVGYRYLTSSLDWMPGNGDQFGAFSIVWNHYQNAGFNSGLGFGAGFHFLSGPIRTDMPPRVFDLSLGYQIRHQLGPLRFDVAAAVLVASDFNANASNGVFFPGHGVGYLSVSPTMDLAFGVDYLDRADIKLLPVAGLVWTPNATMRFEAVFPRPRAVFQLTDGYRLYMAGELGGGTWSIERANFDDDVATYHDLRVSIGVEHVDRSGGQSGIEIAYLFDRRLEYTSGVGNTNLADGVMIRLVTAY